MLGFALLWIAELPFDVLNLWWARRHDLVHQSYWEAIFGGWVALGAEFVFLCVALAIVMGFARLIGDWWWTLAAPAFAALALLFTFVSPYLVPDTGPLRDPKLQATVRDLEQREGVGRIKVVVEKVSSDTSLPNAEAMGIGPSRRIALWDTLLSGRFSDGEVRVVIGHEIGHIRRNHLLKGVAWSLLFFLPIMFVLSRVARIRGGMSRAEAVPLFLFGLVVLGLVLTPLEVAVTPPVRGRGRLDGAPGDARPGGGEGSLPAVRADDAEPAGPADVGLRDAREPPDDHAADRDGRGLAPPLRRVFGVGPGAVELGVAAAREHQLVVRALLDDRAVLEHDDQVGVADRREAVGDDERRAAVQQPSQRALDAALGADVDRARRLVEDQDARVGEERAG